MRRFVIDTNILLAYVRKSTTFSKVEQQFELTKDDVQLLISVVSVGEIQVIARRNKWGDNKLDLIDQFIKKALIIIDITVGAPELIEAYVKFDYISSTSGVKMGKNDLWIAATAYITEATLITTDSDFDYLGNNGLKLARVSVT